MPEPIRLLWLAIMLAMAIAPANAAPAHDYEAMVLDEGTLLLDWRSEFSAPQQATLRRWLASVAAAVSQVHGALPLPSIRVVLQASPGRSAVPFARVLRQAPEGVHFYLSPERTLAEYRADWTAYHEFSHLFIPYPGQADLWFSEGFATWYQQLLQFRAGLLSGAEARAELAAGFARGAADSGHADLTLRELSQEMRQRRAFMRVYWSGTLYFLEAEIALRRAADKNQRLTSLDAVVAEFNRCCRQQERRWTGKELAAEFDRLANTRLFVPLFEQYAASTAMPPYAATLQAPELATVLPVSN